jgi:hypothetical protein
MNEKFEYLWVEMGTGPKSFTGGGQQVHKLADSLNPGKEILYHFLTGPMEALNSLGKEGWEAVSQTNYGETHWVLMKRRLGD